MQLQPSGHSSEAGYLKKGSLKCLVTGGWPQVFRRLVQVSSHDDGSVPKEQE